MKSVVCFMSSCVRVVLSPVRGEHLASCSVHSVQSAGLRSFSNLLSRQSTQSRNRTHTPGMQGLYNVRSPLLNCMRAKLSRQLGAQDATAACRCPRAPWLLEDGCLGPISGYLKAFSAEPKGHRPRRGTWRTHAESRNFLHSLEARSPTANLMPTLISSNDGSFYKSLLGP